MSGTRLQMERCSAPGLFIGLTHFIFLAAFNIFRRPNHTASGVPSAADRRKRRSRRPSSFAEPDGSDDKGDAGFGGYDDSEDDGDWWEDDWSDEEDDDWSGSDDGVGTGEGAWTKRRSGWGSPSGKASQVKDGQGVACWGRTRLLLASVV